MALPFPGAKVITQEQDAVTKKRLSDNPTPIRHTKASKEALDYLIEVLGDRQNASDIIRDAIIEKAEREKAKRNPDTKTA